MEGISHEAIGLAGKQKLSKLIVFWDDNGISIDGKVILSDVTDQKQRFKAAGWSVHECDGHDPDDIERAIVEAKASEWPAFIDCRTHIGFGAPDKQDTKAAHGSPLGDEEIAKVREIYGWPWPPFEIPEDVLAAWRQIGARGAAARAAWEESFGKLSGAKQAEFERVVAGEAPKKLASALAAFRKATAEAAPKVATRKSSEMVLEVVNAVMPETLGGSADLTGSNNTLTKGLGIFDAENRAGRYIHYGIREHGMAAAMNGIAVHGGLRALRRHVPGLQRLCAGRDAAVGADGRAGGLRADPRLDRARRGRADAPADRAPGDAAGDAEHERVPAGGHDRDGGGLGAGADDARARRRCWR